MRPLLGRFIIYFPIEILDVAARFIVPEKHGLINQTATKAHPIFYKTKKGELWR